MKIRYVLSAIAILAASATAYAGAWGYKSFDNDDALDWVQNSLKRDGQAGVEKSIATVANGAGFLEEPQACFVIAACEVLLVEQGKPSPDIPKEVLSIAEKIKVRPNDALRNAARKALDRVLSDKSELNELWNENAADYPKWRKAVETLQKSL